MSKRHEDRLASAVEQFAAGVGRLLKLRSAGEVTRKTGVPCFVIGDGRRHSFLVCNEPAGRIAPRLAKVAPKHDLCLFPGGYSELVDGYNSAFPVREEAGNVVVCAP